MVYSRLEKVQYGSIWAIRRVYKSDGKVIGTIVRNPHTEMYEITKSDFKNRRYITAEKKTLKEAREFLGV